MRRPTAAAVAATAAATSIDYGRPGDERPTAVCDLMTGKQLRLASSSRTAATVADYDLVSKSPDTALTARKGD